MTMRSRFYRAAAELLDDDPHVAVVLAEIGAGELPPHPRLVNVGIREQLLIGVAAGLALEGLRPLVHSYAPFLIERPYEQVKLDLGHQGVGAVLVGTGASYDAAHAGRTHQAPGDVALLRALPGWTIHVPGHEDEAGNLLRRAVAGAGNVYIRLSEETNALPIETDRLAVVRRGSETAPVVVAVGPVLDEVLGAIRDSDVTVAYLSTVRPFDAAGLRALVRGTDVVLVEPYLTGTSAGDISAALSDRPHRLLALGVADEEVRRYGTGLEHRALHGLDAAGIRASLDGFRANPHPGWGTTPIPLPARLPV